MVDGKKCNNQIIIFLDNLFSLADDMYDFEDGIFFENILISIISFIKIHHQYKTQIIDWLIFNIQNKQIPNFEIIPFCMHELRWEEIKVICEFELKNSILNNDWNNINFLLNILESYRDDWQHKDMYSYFSLKLDE